MGRRCHRCKWHWQHALLAFLAIHLLFCKERLAQSPCLSQGQVAYWGHVWLPVLLYQRTIFWSVGTVSGFTLYKTQKSSALSKGGGDEGKSVSVMRGNNKVAPCSCSLVSSSQTSPLQLWTHFRHGTLWVSSWALRINSSFLCTRGQQACFQKGLNSMHFRICGPYGLCRNNNQFCYKTCFKNVNSFQCD